MTCFRYSLSNKQSIKEDKEYVITDGKRFITFSLDEMKKFKYRNNGFFDHKNIWHNAMPSVIASIKLLIEAY